MLMRIGQIKIDDPELRERLEDFNAVCYLKALSRFEDNPVTIPVTVNAVDLLPEVRTYYRYDGSFTTPPCTEGVNWFLMDTPVELSTTQIDAFKEIYSNNYRPVQPLNDREFMTN